VDKTHRCHRGTTVVEGIVYCVIFGIIMTCIYWVLVASMRYYNIANYSVDLQQNGLSAMSSISHDLSESRSSTFTNCTGSSTSGIIFASPRSSSGTLTYDSTTKLLQWTKWVCYYIGTTDGVNYLYRKEYYKTTGEATPVIPGSYSTASQFASDSSLPRKTVAKNIQQIQAELYSDSSVGLRLILDKSPSTDKGNSLELVTRVKLTN
jgi:hypothetical protein